MSSGVFVDVEIDEQVLNRAGYHHEDDCEIPSSYHHEDGCRADVLERALQVMHDEHHEGPFRFCGYDVCREAL